MSTIFQQYEYAKLAAAAYVNFAGVAYTVSGTRKLIQTGN